MDGFGSRLLLLRLKLHLEDISKILAERNWRWKLTVWKQHGEEWEISPVAIIQTKRPTVRAKVTIIDQPKEAS